MSKFKKTANILEKYDSDYTNRFEQVTPYHILFKDHGNELSSLTKDGAIEHCYDLIRDLNEDYSEDQNYYKIDKEELEELKEALEDEKVDSGIDVLFVIKDFLLKSEGMEKMQSRVKRLVKKNNFLF